MQHIIFTLVGDSAILQNNAEAMSKLKPPTDWNPRKQGTWIPAPDIEAEAGAYRLPDGQLAMPSASVYGAIVTAAMSYSMAQTGRQSKKSAKTFAAAALSPEQELLPLYRDREPIYEYEIDTRRCVLNGRAAVQRSRAKVVAPWVLECSFVWRPELPVEALRDLIKDAGTVIGIGNYRPEKKGWFGKFHLGELTITDD